MVKSNNSNIQRSEERKKKLLAFADSLPKTGMTADEGAKVLNVHKSTARKFLYEAAELGLAKTVRMAGDKGAKVVYYFHASVTDQAIRQFVLDTKGLKVEIKEPCELVRELGIDEKMAAMMGYTNHVPPVGSKHYMEDFQDRKHDLKKHEFSGIKSSMTF